MTTKPPPLSEPIAKFWKSPRNRTEHVRVELSEYEGHPLINVRIWQTGSDGIDRPTVKGIALAVRKLPKLAIAAAKDSGLTGESWGGAAAPSWKSGDP